ncbi:hypothetical protein BDQ17DRAFT_1429244 [Cyathus striatus]|nr:hypothetical protein BDQ17DRAFT_1429244 [Cyathus striatus]
MFVPRDELIRMAIVIHKPESQVGHNHPLTSHTRLSYEVKDIYHECILAAGIWGASVQSVENASSTKVILDGKTPALFDDSLMDQHRKKDLITKMKVEHSPGGLGINGVFQLLRKENEALPITERYIHGMWSDGPLAIVLMFDTFLLSLIHEATSFEVDHTFKRVQEFNKWEIVIYSAANQHALTIGRVYTNGHNRGYYKRLFDEFQDVVLHTTSKPLGFKRLINLEMAQILGFGDSIISTNDPVYSGIKAGTTTEEILPYVVKLCHTHARHTLLDFKGLLSNDDFQYLMAFPNMKKEELPVFDEFIEMLNKPKITNWWQHKRKSKWILLTLLESLSLMHSDDWKIMPLTTNSGEGQHHWTNKQMGIKLSLMEAIKRVQRAASSTKKELSKRIHKDEASLLCQKISDVKNEQKESKRRLKDMQDELCNMKDTPSTKTQAEGDSCGRVKTAKLRREAARAATTPYPPVAVNDSDSQGPSVMRGPYSTLKAGLSPVIEYTDSAYVQLRALPGSMLSQLGAGEAVQTDCTYPGSPVQRSTLNPLTNVLNIQGSDSDMYVTPPPGSLEVLVYMSEVVETPPHGVFLPAPNAKWDYQEPFSESQFLDDFLL